MTTREAVPSRSHTHRCIICDEELPWQNPNDPQDCMLSSAVCDSCNDEFEDLLPRSEKDESEDDDLTDREIAEDPGKDWDPLAEYALEFEGCNPHHSDVEVFYAVLQADRNREEEWFHDAPPVHTEQAVTKPLKERKARGKKKAGGWKKD